MNIRDREEGALPMVVKLLIAFWAAYCLAWACKNPNLDQDHTRKTDSGPAVERMSGFDAP